MSTAAVWPGRALNARVSGGGGPLSRLSSHRSAAEMPEKSSAAVTAAAT